MELLIDLPPGTASLSISPAIFNASSELRLANLQVELAALRGQGIDARLPHGQRSLSGVKSPWRNKVSGVMWFVSTPMENHARHRGRRLSHP